MEIQDGEGPTSPPLLGPVFLGQTLSLVFTLADDVFNFDSNVLIPDFIENSIKYPASCT